MKQKYRVNIIIMNSKSVIQENFMPSLGACFRTSLEQLRHAMAYIVAICSRRFCRLNWDIAILVMNRRELETRSFFKLFCLKM